MWSDITKILFLFTYPKNPFNRAFHCAHIEKKKATNFNKKLHLNKDFFHQWLPVVAIASITGSSSHTWQEQLHILCRCFKLRMKSGIYYKNVFSDLQTDGPINGKPFYSYKQYSPLTGQRSLCATFTDYFRSYLRKCYVTFLEMTAFNKMLLCFCLRHAELSWMLKDKHRPPHISLKAAILIT